jgi:trigger factor
LHKAYLKQRNKISIPGFRKGRVPRQMIEAQFGKDFFYEEALEFMFPVAYDEALKKHNLDVVSRPMIDTFHEVDGGAVIVIQVYTRPIIELGDYSGIEYTAPETTATEEEIMNNIEQERQKNAILTTITDRPAQNGDITSINFEGFVDGITFEGGKAEDHELILGSGSFIPGFEEQIEGKNIDEEFDVNVTFPESYHAPDLAGKPAVFKVKLLDVKYKALPELDDIFAQEVSEFDTLAEYKADLKAKIEKSKEDKAEREIDNQIATALGEMVTADIPEAMIENETENMVRDFANMLQSRGMDFRQYMQMTGMTVDKLRETYTEQAAKNVKSRLAISTIVRQENIEASEEEYDEEIERMAEMYGVDKERLLADIDDDMKKNIIKDIKANKAIKLAKQSAISS